MRGLSPYAFMTTADLTQLRTYAALDPYRVDPRAKTEPTEPEQAILTWGGPSSFAIPEGPGYEVTDGQNKLSEVSRSTSTKRVSNPDDPSQFVDVEQIDAMQLRDAGGQTHAWKFQN